MNEEHHQSKRPRKLSAYDELAKLTVIVCDTGKNKQAYQDP